MLVYLCRPLAAAALLSLLAAPPLVLAAAEAPVPPATPGQAEEAASVAAPEAPAEAVLAAVEAPPGQPGQPEAAEAAEAAAPAAAPEDPARVAAAAAPTMEEDARAAALAQGTARARADLFEAARTGSGAAANRTAAGEQAHLRGAAGWGRGIFGEVCCMCARQYGLTTILYAAEDYSQAFGSRTALYFCNRNCDVKCLRRSGQKFGCYDEQQLIQLDQLYGNRQGYQILHDSHFGNIC